MPRYPGSVDMLHQMHLQKIPATPNSLIICQLILPHIESLFPFSQIDDLLKKSTVTWGNAEISGDKGGRSGEMGHFLSPVVCPVISFLCSENCRLPFAGDQYYPISDFGAEEP